MYRSILSKKPNLQEFEFECNGCGRISFRQIDCPVTGTKAGAGFEYVCTKCRGTLKQVSKTSGVLNTGNSGDDKSECDSDCPKCERDCIF
jgi:hypothetical protein